MTVSYKAFNYYNSLTLYPMRLRHRLLFSGLYSLDTLSLVIFATYENINGVSG